MSITNSIGDPRLPQLTAAAAPALLAPPEPRWPSRIVVCAHDSASTGDALAVTRALAVRFQAEVDVLAVFGPRIPVPDVSDKHGSARCEAPDRGAVAELIRAVRSEERERFDGRVPWPVHIEVGNTVKVITDNARRMSVELVVVGLGSRDPSERSGSVAIPASLARYIEVPMLAAAPMSTALPQQAVLFVDRDSPNPAMISAALRCVEAAAFVWVLMYAGTSAHSGDGVKHDKNTLNGIMKMIRREARAISKGIVVRALYRSGDPVDAILSLVRDVNADLIVTPVHGTAGIVRSVVPNIADRLLLTAPCSVLVVPDA